MKAILILALLPLALAHHAAHPEWAERQLAVRNNCGNVCLLSPEEIEGPYYIDYDLHRRDITEGLPGIPLRLTIDVFEVSSNASNAGSSSAAATATGVGPRGNGNNGNGNGNGNGGHHGGNGNGHGRGGKCPALPRAYVDVWQANAVGVYSGYGTAAELGVQKRNWNEVVLARRQATASAPATTSCPPPPYRDPNGTIIGGGPPIPNCGPDHIIPTNDLTFLRGVQQTDRNGRVVFDTIYPGWYAGRTVHIHVKVHSPAWESTGRNETRAYTTQIYFSQEVNDYIATLAPNKNNKTPRIANSQDLFFHDENVVATRYVGKLSDFNGKRTSGHIEASIKLGVDRWW